MPQFSVLSVFLSGALSFISPCVLPLVPPYLCYMAGISIDDFRSDENKRKGSIRLALLSSVFSFIIGFTTVFIMLGASASAIGKLIANYRGWFSIASGVIIIIVGLNFLGIFRINFLSQELRFQARKTPAGFLGAYVIGLAFAFGWTPCIGPILGSVLALAGTKETVSEGMILLGVYSLGLSVPFVLAALFSSSFMQFLRVFRVHLGKIEKIIGLVLVITGVLFLTDSMQFFSFWLLEHYPFGERLG